MHKKKEPLPQGNQPGDDPNKYGLKFDSGKARWDLIPMKQLLRIIEVPNILLRNGCIKYLTGGHDDKSLFNMVMTHMAEWRSGETCKVICDPPILSRLPLSAFNLFFLLRGKPYTIEELESSSVKSSKYRWDLFNIEDINKIVEVYSYGAKLYADDNWKRVNVERYVGAFFRHLKTVKSKSRFDDESGLLHLYHAIWNLITLMWFEDK